MYNHQLTIHSHNFHKHSCHIHSYSHHHNSSHRRQTYLTSPITRSKQLHHLQCYPQKVFGITPAYAGKTNLEYIDTKRVLLNNIPQRDSRGINLSPTAVISNTPTESITKILYKVKTEKDLADTKYEPFMIMS